MSTAPGGMFLPKPKSGATSIDADGKVVRVEVREDEEQGRKLQEIVDLLVAAGYFRARIKGLSAFDKVVGGLVWCVENCNFDVDVDLLFQENLTIGQKISLTEKIVAVLPAMECPHRIEPHQIQGLDCIHIFPVIQWLVKRSLETRQETGAQIRSLAISQFSRIFPKISGQMEKQEEQDTVAANYMQVKEKYGVARKYRRRDAAPKDEESQVQSTLLEYGHLRLLGATVETKTEGSETPEISEEQQQEEKQKEEQKLATLMQGMDIASSNESGRVAAAVVGNIVGLRAEEIAQAAEQYAGMKEELQASPGGAEGSLARRKAVLTRKRDALLEQVSRHEVHNAELTSQLATAEGRLDQAKQGQAKLQEALSMLADLENAENKGLVRQLHSLIVLNDSLKQQEAQFKQHCHSELTRLQNLVAGAEQSPSPGSDDTLTQQLEEEKERLSKLRLQLAKRNRSIASLQRQMDEVPGRAELAQYQRRFLELYTQVSGKHKETKQYYTLYNTLHDTQMYLNKELSLLNSIQDNYAQAMSSSSSKEQFLQQFESIVQGIKHNKTKVETRRNDEKTRRERLSQGLLALVEQQRRYVAAVRQLTIECRNNETLLAQIRSAETH